MPGGIHGGKVLAVLIRGVSLELRHHQVHGQLQFVVVLAVVVLELRNVGGPRFADQDGAKFVGRAAQFAHHIVYFRQFLVVLLLHVRPAEFISARQHRIVGELRIFE